MSSAAIIFWVIVSGIAGTLLSALAAIVETIRATKDIRPRVRIIPSDATITTPSEIQIHMSRRY